MPIYVFECNCGFRNERFLNINSDPAQLIKCDSCSKEFNLRRNINVPGLIFKGSDWTPKHFNNRDRKQA